MYLRQSSFFLVLLLTAGLSRGYSQTGTPVYKDPAFIDAILKQHNIYRTALNLSPLVWSADLAADAEVWAKHLAAKDNGEHDQSARGKEGENIFWGTTGAYGYAEMVDFWASEKKQFVYGTFPDVTTSRKAVVGHYTQMIWKTTTSVGCALVGNGQKDYLVCRYSPPGNIVGQKPY